MEIKFNCDSEARQQKPAEIVASTDDLVTAILLRLPVISLIRIKLVCKHWISLITNPRFCHLRIPNPNPAVGLFLPLPSINSGEDHELYEYVPFCTQKSTNPPFRKLSFTKDLSVGVKILQSCNGLLLCCSSTAANFRNYFVYNPTTSRFSLLPNPDEINGICKRICGMSLAIDPVKSHCYKVVCVWSLELNSVDSKFLIEIFSSATRSWRFVGEPFTALVNFENGVYWNGAIHWLTISRNGESLYFNIEHQTFDKMPALPLIYGLNSKSNYYFGESCDHLHFIDLRSPAIQFNAFEMRRDYSEWFVKYHVNLSEVISANPSMILGFINLIGWYSFLFSVFIIVRGEQEADSFLVLQTPDKVIRYNLESKTFENL